MGKLSIEYDNGITVLVAGSSLDLSFKDDVKVFLEAQNKSDAPILLDVEKTNMVYSFGVAAVQNLCDLADENKRVFALCNVNHPEVIEVFEISALLKRCKEHTYKTREEAIEVLSAL